MFTVKLKNWHNNWSDPVEEEPFEDLKAATAYADKYDCFTSTPSTEIGFENCYFNNGCEAWVEDFAGNRIYSAS
tara:strand:+ start:11280 stop:11501 length:222 start_codon:yes stop_codon:yes gene_type:complete